MPLPWSFGLPPLFTGNPRQMLESYQDSIAITRFKHHAVNKITGQIRKPEVIGKYQAINFVRETGDGQNFQIRVKLIRRWSEVHPMSVDLLLADENGYEVHGVVPGNLISRFSPFLREGGSFCLEQFQIADAKYHLRPARNSFRIFSTCKTIIKPLASKLLQIPQYKFNFAEFEVLTNFMPNMYLTDVVGLLTHVALQRKAPNVKTKGSSGYSVHELTLQNIRGCTIKVIMWDDRVLDARRILQYYGLEKQTLVVVVAGTYVQKIQGLFHLHSTSSTQEYFDVYIIRTNSVFELGRHPYFREPKSRSD